VSRHCAGSSTTKTQGMLTRSVPERLNFAPLTCWDSTRAATDCSRKEADYRNKARYPSRDILVSARTIRLRSINAATFLFGERSPLQSLTQKRRRKGALLPNRADDSCWLFFLGSDHLVFTKDCIARNHSFQFVRVNPTDHRNEFRAVDVA